LDEVFIILNQRFGIEENIAATKIKFSQVILIGRKALSCWEPQLVTVMVTPDLIAF
jgi:hypothetical protein